MGASACYQIVGQLDEDFKSERFCPLVTWKTEFDCVRSRNGPWVGLGKDGLGCACVPHN